MKRTMLPMPEPRAMAASVSCYRVVQVDVRAPFDKGRLVVRGHVTESARKGSLGGARAHSIGSEGSMLSIDGTPLLGTLDWL